MEIKYRPDPLALCLIPPAPSLTSSSFHPLIDKPLSLTSCVSAAFTPSSHASIPLFTVCCADEINCSFP